MKNCYFAMLLLLSAAFAAGCADDKEEGGNDIKLNPDPTQLSNITLMKATFAADEFNMISSPVSSFSPMKQSTTVHSGISKERTRSLRWCRNTRRHTAVRSL